MNRQLRIEYPDVLYHVMSYGTGNLWLYKTPEDFKDFLELLINVKNKYKFEIPNNNAVSQRIYKMEKKLKKDTELNILLDKIEFG